ncbi:DUF6607 family protein [Aurantivibrio infirmus]
MLKILMNSRLALSGLFLVFSLASHAQEQKKDCEQLRQFTFSWQFVDQCGLKPRGGSSTGAGLVLDKLPHPGWLAVQESGISDHEKDRRAILAMAGGYRASFDFIETVGYKPNYRPDPPYQSWGTEYVYVVEDKKDFISLQHILVMQYVDADGKVSEPFVQKHWRQDWQYEKRDLLVYAGNEVRKHKKYSRKEVKGTWAQAVYQVDDSPRYEAKGKWQHYDNFSTWLSDETWRPVPRRETTLRKDYQVLIGTNRHTITPTGWVQEEENYKTVLDENGKPSGNYPYLSKEIGVNRYERLKDFDFSEGDKYWQATKKYWHDVKIVWDEIIAENKTFTLKRTHEGTPLFMATFMQADEVMQQSETGKEIGKDEIREVLEKYVE